MHAWPRRTQSIDTVMFELHGRAGDPSPATQSWLIAKGVCERRAIRRLSEIESLLRGIDACLQRFEYAEHERGFIQLCVHEALVNAIKHGNGNDPDKQVRVECRIDGVHFWIRIADEGAGFRPEDVPDPRLPENLNRSSGRGVFMMRTYMDYVRYNACGNVVELHKRRSGLDQPRSQ